MKYLIIILLVGIAIYFAMKWQKPKQQRPSGEGSDDNPYRSNSGSGSRNSQSSGFDSGPYNQGGTSNKKVSGSSYAKWVGGGLGWAFGGPIGGILGFMFGSMFDGMSGGQPEYGQTQTGDFNISLLTLTAAVMKADGSVKRSELDYVKQYYYSNFGQEHGSQYIKLLGEILKQDFNVQEIAVQIGRHMDYSSKLLLVQFLFGIALADGKHHPTEVSLIQSISRYMNITTKDFESVKAMFIKDTNSAYKILEVEPTAPNDEIKKAYRELAKKYHPDKVTHLGEDVKQAAEQKFTKLNSAYEAVKQERGMV